MFLSSGENLPIPREIIDKYSLTAGVSLPEEKYHRIKHEADLMRAENYLLYLLSRRSYTYGHLALKLAEKGFEKILINGLLNDFTRRGLIDDRAYARQMTESILRRKPAGRNFIIARLRAGYIPRQIAEAVVDEILEDVDEYEIAVKLMRLRKAYFSKFDLETARRKAYNYLSRRSIGYRAAQMAFEKIMKEDD
nr:regulatory protein RecX [candidate division Zixibacteria bacterium]